jgi:serine/threonine protein kinase
LHSIKAVAHGDIKPENVIISPKTSQLVLVDFGSAWVLEQMTRRDRGDGESPLYAAPEVLNGGRLTFASDQFSASMVYYEMLTNRMPYHPIGGQAGNAPAGTLPADSLKPPSEIAPLAEKTPQRVWQIIDEITLRGLEFTPRERFPNGKQWRDGLDQLDLEMRTETELKTENRLLVRLIEATGRLFRK